MKKSEVYSWRLTAELKSRLENAAKTKEVSVSGLLQSIVESWLARQQGSREAEEQERLQSAAAAAFGAIRGGDPSRSRRARELVRSRLRERHGG